MFKILAHLLENWFFQTILSIISLVPIVIGKAKAVILNDQALLKLIFLAAQNITAKWNSPIQNWALVVQQLAIHFEGRFKIDLNIDGH